MNKRKYFFTILVAIRVERCMTKLSFMAVRKIYPMIIWVRIRIYGVPEFLWKIKKRCYLVVYFSYDQIIKDLKKLFLFTLIIFIRQPINLPSTIEESAPCWSISDSKHNAKDTMSKNINFFILWASMYPEFQCIVICQKRLYCSINSQ